VTAVVHYRVQPADPQAHRFHVGCILPDADGAALSFRMPAWIRGSYLVRDFAKHVSELKVWRGDVATPIRRLDKSRFEVAAGATGPLVLSYDVHAWDESVRKAWLDARRGFFNGSSLFYCPVGAEHAEFRVELCAPQHDRADAWRVATAMTPVDIDARGFGYYRCLGYEELIDQPVEMGEFERHDFDVDGIPHALVLSGRNDADIARITADLTRICRVERELFGHEPALDQYLFLTRVVGSGYGGLEHRASTALICSRADLPRPGAPRTPSADADYHRFLGLCSHEYFHLWNVKRLVPLAFAESDLSREAYTRDLWHYEGVTSYYDDLFLMRAGILDAPAYLDLLAETATRLERSPALHVQTVEDASFEAWIKFYQPDDNTPNQATNYYVKGALIALCLDLKLRLVGQCTLDDVMRALWKRYGRELSPLPEAALEATASAMAGADLSAFFDAALRSTDELPLAELLAEFGVRAERRAQTSAIDNGGRIASGTAPPWVGLKLKAGEPMIAYVTRKGPAEQAGLAVGDQIVAIDGLRVTAGSWRQRLERLAPGVAVRLDYFRGDELLQASLTPETAPPDTWSMTLSEAAKDSAGGAPADGTRLARRRAWLGV